MELQYPIGRFAFSGVGSGAERGQFIDQIEQTPAQLRRAVAGLSEPQLDTPYRPGG